MNTSEAYNKSKACSVCKTVKRIHGNYRISQKYKNGNVTYRAECNNCMAIKIEISTFFRAVEKREFLIGIINRLEEKSKTQPKYVRHMQNVFSVMADSIKGACPLAFQQQTPQPPPPRIPQPVRPVAPQPVRPAVPQPQPARPQVAQSSTSRSPNIVLTNQTHRPVGARPPTPHGRK